VSLPHPADAPPCLCLGAGPHLASLVSDYPAQIAAASCESLSPAVMFWDTVYLAMGLTAFGLPQHMDLPGWLRSCLEPCIAALLRPSAPRPPVLLRRLTYVLACYCGEIEPEHRPPVYSLLVRASVLPSGSWQVDRRGPDLGG
jgi:hypothetical protein